MGRYEKTAVGNRDLDEIILNVLGSGSRTPTELKKACLKIMAGTSAPTYHRHLKKLIERGEIEKVEKYQIPLESRVKRVIEDLRFHLLREPTIREVAREIGKTPEETRKLVWRLIPKTGWREPSKKQIRLTEQKLHEVYEIAALLEHFPEESVRKRAKGIPERWTEDRKIINPGIIRLRGEPLDKIFDRAKYALKHERDKLPSIVIVKENHRQIEFDHHWPEPPEESEFGWLSQSEIYDKITKSLSGAFTGKRQIKIGEEEENERPLDIDFLK